MADQQASEKLTADYGTWASTITPDAVLSSSSSMSELSSDGNSLYWLENIDDEHGRRTAVMKLADDEVTVLTPKTANIRSRVHEYGGGAYHVDAGYVVWLDDNSGIWLLEPTGRMRQLSEKSEQLRYGDLRVNAAQKLVLAVEEEYLADQIITRLVAIDFAGEPSLHRIKAGADFYANPALRDDGMLAWLEWDIPAMPWDACRCYVAKLQDFKLGELTLVAGADPADGLSPWDQIAVAHPLWAADGALRFSSDASGYYQWLSWRDGEVQALHSSPHDFDLPLFILGVHNHVDWHDGVLTCYYDQGYCQLTVLNAQGPTDLCSISALDSLAVAQGRAYAIVERPNANRAIVEVLPDGRLETVRILGDQPDANNISVARSLILDGEYGPIQAWYYPPCNARYQAGRGQRPPLLVRAHGGPISMATNAYYPLFQYWTSRGFAVLDVNYSGSAGFGRSWRNRLRGLWGIADVADCLAATEAVIDAGLADPGKIIITGNSAGGFTALSSLINTNRYAAGISQYGVTDLVGLVGGHKFEARMCDSLVGPWPQAREQYVKRSPINNLEKLAKPILIMQGDADPVVPLQQATSLAEAARAKQLPLAFLVFANEGHGFSSPEARRDALLAQHSFICQLFGLQPAEQLPKLEIENLA